MSRPPVKNVDSSLNLATAESIASAVVTTAREHDTLPLCVAILDAGGQLVNFKREDGCGVLRAEIAFGKAYAALGMGMSSRTIGKALAMDVVLTGRFLTAAEAERHGLVSRVVPREHWYAEALKIAHQMAALGPIALKNAKESVLNSEEQFLSDGLKRERRLFYDLFDTEDQKEGMGAFLEKRKPTFTGR